MTTGIATGAGAGAVRTGEAAGLASTSGTSGFAAGSPAQRSVAESFGARFQSLISSLATLPGSSGGARTLREADSSATAVPARGAKIPTAAYSPSGAMMGAGAAVSGQSATKEPEESPASSATSLPAAKGGTAFKDGTASSEALPEKASSPEQSSPENLSSSKACSKDLSSAAAEPSESSVQAQKQSENAYSSGARKAGPRDKDSRNSSQAVPMAVPASDSPVQQLPSPGMPFSLPVQPVINAVPAASEANGEATTQKNSGGIRETSHGAILARSGGSGLAEAPPSAPVSRSSLETAESATGAREASAEENRFEPPAQLKLEGESRPAVPAADFRPQPAAEAEMAMGSARAQSAERSAQAGAQQMPGNDLSITDATLSPASPAIGPGATISRAVHQKTTSNSAAEIGSQRAGGAFSGPLAATPAEASAMARVPAAEHGLGGTKESVLASGTAENSAQHTFTVLDAGTAVGNPGWVHAGTRRAEAGFEDPALGWIGVRAEMGAGGIHASLVPASAEAAQVLGGHIEGLNHYLAQERSPVETLNLASMESGGAHAGAGQGGAQQQPGGSGGQWVADREQSSGRSGLSPPAREISFSPSGPDAAPVSGPSSGKHISVMA